MKRIILVTIFTVSIITILCYFALNQDMLFGAPSQINIVSSTSSPPVSFTIGTTTAATDFGTTTLAVYGSTTIQTSENTEHAFEILNAASSTVFQVDTANSSTTILNTLNTQVLNVVTCNGCPGGGTDIIPGLSWDFFDGILTFIRPTTTVGIVVSASSTIETLSIQNHLGASTTAQFATLSVNDLTSGDFVIGGGADGYFTSLDLNTNGALLIGDGSGVPTAATLTAGTDIGIANGAGSITISNERGIPWSYIDDTVDFLTPTSTLTVGIGIFASSTIETLHVPLTLTIPQAANPTVSAVGVIAIQTQSASTSLRVHDGVERSVFFDFERSVYVSSSSRDRLGIPFSQGTSTFEIFNFNRSTTLDNYFCKTDTGTANVMVGDGDASTTQVVANAAGDFASSLGFASQGREDIIVQVRGISGTPNRVSCTFSFFYTLE